MTGKMHYFVNKHYLLGLIRMDTGGKISSIRVKIDVVRDRRANGQHQAIRRRRGNHSKTVRELDIDEMDQLKESINAEKDARDLATPEAGVPEEDF